MPSPRPGTEAATLVVCRTLADLPAGITRPDLVRFFHESMKPYQDHPEDIDRALGYAFGTAAAPRRDGFLVLAIDGPRPLSGLLMLATGMGGYVPANLLLFVATLPELRGRGLGRTVCERALSEVEGDVKLHVEYENPAKRLYERLGFTTKYAEMRLVR